MHGKTIPYLCVFSALKPFPECASPASSSTPKDPIYAKFTSPFSSYHSIRAALTTPVDAVVHCAVTSTHPPPNLSRKGTLLHRLHTFYENATRPFTLSGPRYDFAACLGAASAAASSTTFVDTTHPARKRADTSSTLLEKTASSSSTVTTSAPYQLPQ
ncbi:hypothetical protein EI94DRAFT_799361 [Lactarius quietus]|nr:hypothetical protein EI94DRAFT_799361 [Lactarius quietus]